ncbi:zinc ribbon domain-containing protein, partial [Cronobacter sakazakii]
LADKKEAQRCPACGAKYQKQANYCQACGVKIRDEK